MNNDPSILRPIAVFLTVVSLGSFRRAADELGLSAPLTSQIVSGLEDLLGQQLLYRSTRKVTLTDAGERFAREMAPSFEAISDAVAAFRSGMSAPRGRLRVTAPTVLAQPAFARFVQRYVQENPDVRLEIDLSDEHRDPISSGHDFALRIGRLDGGDRVCRRLFQTEGILCAGPDFRVGSPDQLARETFVRPPEVPGVLELRRDGETVRVAPDRELVVNHGGMVRELLRFGGYAAFPAFTVGEALAKGELVRILPDYSLGPVDVHALFTARRARLSNARHFADALERFIREL